MHFTLDGSWTSVGESSNVLSVGARTPAEGRCELRYGGELSACFDTISFFGAGLLDGFELAEVLGSHSTLVGAARDTDLNGEDGLTLQLFIPYEIDDSMGPQPRGPSLPSEYAEVFPSEAWSGLVGRWGAVRLIHVPHRSLLVQIHSPTAEGLELFEPRAQQVLESIEFADD